MDLGYEPNHITEAQVNHLCLCTGYDGVGRGLREVFPGLRTVAYVEIEAFAVANLVAKSEAEQMDAAPIFTDVKTFPYRKFRGCVDILSAGFPCQPFSSAGKRKATEDPRHLYPYIADGITLCEPRYVLLENVEGIVSAKTADGESVLLYVLRDLESRGYECAWGTFSAAEIGAPHLRKRIFILAKLDNSNGGNERPHGLEHRVLSTPSTEGEASRLERTSDVAKLGYPKHDGLSTSEDWGSVSEEQEKGRMQELEGRCRESSLYPARPGQEQYEWESPRVVSNSNSETQSDMGGADDGATNRLNTTTNRVDRLRLLGNGVVPDTCTFAVRSLWNKLN
tara:strand:- start:2626 stop:3639 length:1014 start_codon:yes stop_codon:yes gene_type:complete